MRSPIPLQALGAVLLVLVGTAFAGTRPLKDPQGAFTLEVPEDWKAQAGDPNFVVAEAPRGRAKLVAWSQARQAQSLDEFAHAVILDETRAHADWAIPLRETVLLCGLEGIHIRRSRADEKLQEEFFLVLAPHHYVVVSLQCPEKERAGNEAAFGAVAESLRLLDVGPPPQPAAQAPPSPQVEPPKPDPPEPGPPPPPGPPPAAMRPLRDPAGAFSLVVPADWREVRQQAGNTEVIDPTQRAWIVARATPRRSQTLEEYAQDVIASARRQTPGWQQVSQWAIEIGGRPALVVRATGTPGGQAYAADYVLVLGDGWQALLMLSCPQGELEQRQPVFQPCIESFRVR